MEYVRQWKVGDKTFFSKLEAQRYEAIETLAGLMEAGPDSESDVETLIRHADRAIELLRPFATKRTRAPKGNGASKRSAKSTQAQAAA